MSIAEKLTTIAENEQKVYEAGQKAEYDRFWDAFQKNGNRKDYRGAFSGDETDFNDENFKPKYDIVPNNLHTAFHYNYGITDLVASLDKAGVVLDTSNCDSLLQTFQGAATKHIPTIDASKSTNLGYTFGSNCGVETIDKFILSENTRQVGLGGNTFMQARYLKNIVFEGVITESINLSWSPLTVDSMKSVISCLKNYAGTENELTYKVSFTEACWEALETSGAAPDGGTWADYVQYALGWTV